MDELGGEVLRPTALVGLLYEVESIDMTLDLSYRARLGDQEQPWTISAGFTIASQLIHDRRRSAGIW